MQFTGERYIPNIEGPEIFYEHWHRYLYASRFVAGKTVLDIASGEGFGSAYLARSAGRVIGVDVDPEAVRHAASKYIRPNLEFRCGSAEVIPLEGSQLLDVVVSFETIEHIAAQQQLQFMNEVKRLLRPEGVFLVSTPNKLLDTDLPSQKNPFHRKEFYFDEYLGLLHKYFRTVHILGQQVYPVSYIWQASASSQSLTEFQLAYSGGVFEPLAGDHKEVLYLLALCSDGEMEVPGNSVLLDISERAIRRPVEQWAKTDQALRQAGANLAANEKTIQALQLKESETSQRGDAQLQQAVEEHALALSAQRDAAQQQIGREWHLDLTALNDLSAQQGAAQQQIAAQQQQIEELANAKAAAQSAAAELHLQIQGLTNEKAATQSAVVELQRRVEELINEKEAGLREAAELRQAAQELKEQASASAAQVQLMAEREKELREMLLDAHDKLLRRDEEIQATWATALSQCGPTIAGILAARNGTAPAKTNNYPRLVQQIREVARKKLPADAVVLVVSKGDQELLRLDRRKAGHFPQDERGVYAGHHPADSAAAIDHLEALRARGAEFLLFPSTSLWWLDHYQEFRQHLKRHYEEVVRLEDVCVIFALNERPTGKEQPYRELVERIRESVHRCLPPNVRVCVVSKGDEELLRLGPRTAWHFSQDEYGVYLGHNPADSAAAIALLEASRVVGADFLLFPSTTFWWLDHYREFRHYLESRYGIAVREDDTCLVYDLNKFTNQLATRRSFGVNVAGNLTSEKGIGEAVRSDVRSLEAANVPIVLNNLIDAGSANRDRAFTNLSDDNPHAFNLIHVNADLVPEFVGRRGDSYFRGRYNIAYWAWELSAFPNDWDSSFQYFDEIWVPSNFVLDAVSRASPIPVVRVPPSIPEDLPVRPLGRAHFGIPEGKFVFLFMFDFHSYMERKHPAGLIKAFRNAFPSRDEAVLVLKSSRGAAGELAELNKAAAGANVHIIDGVLSREEVNTLLHLSDCYVSLHRSEGFGLTMAEAMSLEKPVIATAYSGNMDFMTPSNSFLVNYQLMKLATDHGPYKRGCVWADPDLDHAAELMRFVYDNQTKAREVGHRGRQDILQGFHPQVVGKLIKQRLLKIAASGKMTISEDGDFGKKGHATSKIGAAPEKDPRYRQLVDRIRDVVRAGLPPDATVIVVSKGDDELLDLGGREAWHFPQRDDGVYAGHHPADSAAAIAHLEVLRARGARFLLFPSTALWWLEFYSAFRQHLEGRYRRVKSEESCVIYDLSGPGSGLLRRLLRRLTTYVK